MKYYHIFLLDKEAGRTDAKLRLRVRWGSNIVAFGLGYRVDVEKWNTDTQRCKTNTTHGKHKTPASKINREINRYEEAVEELFASYELNKITPDKKQFRDDVLEKVRGITRIDESALSFWHVYDNFVKEMGFKNAWTDATYNKFRALKSHLLHFNANLEFADLNEDCLNGFISYLRDVAGMRNTTIEKQLGFLKWMLRWASAKGYNQMREYENFHPKLKKAEHKVVFLEWDELMAVYNYEIPASKSYLDRVRDVFCFCCFTSLRYSDVAKLTWANISNNCINITTVKTNDSLRIELNDYSKSIIDKYRNASLPGGIVLPVISNQKMNVYLKELGKFCGIDSPITITYYKGHERIDEVHPKYELLGTHTGRRTFICNALMLGISPEIVMKWTGHSDYKAMKPYIDVADSAKKKAMELFNKK